MMAYLTVSRFLAEDPENMVTEKSDFYRDLGKLWLDLLATKLQV
jgi:hypothetical protein